MRANRLPRPGALRFAPLPACLLVLSACVGDTLDQAAVRASNPQPLQATYRCDEGDALHVARVGGAMQVTDAEGDTVVLPPSPPGQNTRYGMDGYALVVEGGDALWMKAGATPRDCTQRGGGASID